VEALDDRRPVELLENRHAGRGDQVGRGAKAIDQHRQHVVALFAFGGPVRAADHAGPAQLAQQLSIGQQ